MGLLTVRGTRTCGTCQGDKKVTVREFGRRATKSQRCWTCKGKGSVRS